MSEEDGTTIASLSFYSELKTVSSSKPLGEVVNRYLGNLVYESITVPSVLQWLLRIVISIQLASY
jgi:hypothetical protein